MEVFFGVSAQYTERSADNIKHYHKNILTFNFVALKQ
jgi:hypothetical protein